MKSIFIAAIVFATTLVRGGAEVAEGVVLPPDYDRAVFLVDWKRGMSRAKSSATSKDVEALVLRARLVGKDGIDDSSVFRKRYRRVLEADTFMKKPPYLVCTYSEYTMGAIYFKILQGGKWSEEKSASASGNGIEVITLDKDVEGVMITRAQFK